MKISTDNGKTWKKVNQLRVWVEVMNPLDMDDDEAPETGEVHFNFTEEGMITDLYVGNACEGTDSITYEELGDRLVDG